MDELKIISDMYDFILWMIKHTEKFPRQHRYSIGIQIENTLYTTLKMLLKAKYSRNPLKILHSVNIELESIRFLIRITKDLKILSIKSYNYAAKSLQGIGQQLGGWIKQRTGAKV